MADEKIDEDFTLELWSHRYDDPLEKFHDVDDFTNSDSDIDVIKSEVNVT